MANLLEEQQQVYAEAVAQMKDKPQKPQSEQTDTDELIASLAEENVQLKEEVALQIAMTTAMK
eukprot:1117308-Prorocentrum_lima.AAC.1